MNQCCAGMQPSTGSRLSPEDDPDTIHIFSVASGHMYERLQKIMILSVIRNTRSACLVCPRMEELAAIFSKACALSARQWLCGQRVISRLAS